jgi:2-oxoglutarate dehydrogenase E2 component (dihydrolipoamide succinyltransferase)
MLKEIRPLEIPQSDERPYVGRWFKKIGDAVTVGEPIVEILAGERKTEVAAPDTGVLSEIRLRDGEFVHQSSVLGTVNCQ